MKKRIGLIGMGDIAMKAYLPVLSVHEQVELIGVASQTRATVNQVCERYRIKQGFTSLDSLLRLEPDAVFVHSPTESHFTIVKECLQRGVPVYVDKPLSESIEETGELTRLAERKNVLLGVGFNRRFAPLYLKAKAWLDEVGGIEGCAAQKHRSYLQEAPARKTMYDDLIHIVDLLLWLGAGIKELSSFTRSIDETGRFVHASGQIDFGRTAGYFSMHRRAGTDMERLELYGGGRSAEVNNLEAAVLRDQVSGSREIRFGSWDPVPYRRGFTGIIQHFLDSLERPEACSIRADLVLDTHLLVEKMVR